MAKILVLATICIVSLWTGQAHGRGVEVEDPIAVRAVNYFTNFDFETFINIK